MKKLIIILTALLAFGGASAQKQVKQIFFPPSGYDIYGDNDYEKVALLYTVNTCGSVPLSDVKISGLDTAQLGLKNLR